MNMRSVMSITLIWMGMVAPVLGFQTAAVFPVSRVEHVDRTIGGEDVGEPLGTARDVAEQLHRPGQGGLQVRA